MFLLMSYVNLHLVKRVMKYSVSACRVHFYGLSPSIIRAFSECEFHFDMQNKRLKLFLNESNSCQNKDPFCLKINSKDPLPLSSTSLLSQFIMPSVWETFFTLYWTPRDCFFFCCLNCLRFGCRKVWPTNRGALII